MSSEDGLNGENSQQEGLPLVYKAAQFQRAHSECKATSYTLSNGVQILAQSPNYRVSAFARRGLKTTTAATSRPRPFKSLPEDHVNCGTKMPHNVTVKAGKTPLHL